MNIKEIRQRTGLSQREFAGAAGIPVRTLQQWEQGRTVPPDYVISMLTERMANHAGREMPQTDYAEKYRLPDRARWRVCVDEPYMNCEKTHPLQQRNIRALISEMKNDPDVRQIIVFGSSVTDRCHVGSDVDIYAVTSTDKMPVKGSYDFEYDLWTNFTADKRLKEEIMRKGVCVYVRGA